MELLVQALSQLISHLVQVMIDKRHQESTLSDRLARALLREVEQRLGTVRGGEFARLPGGDWRAAADAAAATVRRMTPFTISDAIDADLLPDVITERALAADPGRAEAAGLSDNGRAVYRRLIAEASAQIVDFVLRHDEFPRHADATMLRRSHAMQAELTAVRKALEPSARDQAFETRFRRQVAQRLDSLQLFGVTLQRSGAYSLSTAYLSLCATPDRPGGSVARIAVETALADRDHVMIRGEAGSGKTTLLQWLAVNSARDDGVLPRGWGPAVPFLITLRRFARGTLPGPDTFPEQVLPALAGEAPPGWAQRVLDAGRGLVLIDGVDELPAAQRAEVWTWLHDLRETYPRSRYVVTSRPPALDQTVPVPPAFGTFMLLPMGSAEVRAFIAQWHAAMIRTARDPAEADRLAGYEHELNDKIAQRRDLRRLTTNPLLCAVICALHLDRFRQLPRDRMGLYHAALEMLLVRRDEARAVEPDGPVLSQADQETLLSQLAYWLVRNGRSDADRGEAGRRLARYAAAIPHLAVPAGTLLDQLLLRSGVLREPVPGRIDFLHKTFQEYLAAKAVLDEGDVDALIANARDDHWREVVVMAVGHARRPERERIIRGLLHAGTVLADPRRHSLLAAACLQHSGPLDPALTAEVKARAEQLMPPGSVHEANQLANAGEVVLDLVPDIGALTGAEALLILHLIRRFDPEEALPVLARLARHPAPEVRAQLAGSWPEVAPEEYAGAVLAPMDLSDVYVRADSDARVAALATLPGVRNLIVQNADAGLSGWQGDTRVTRLAAAGVPVARLTAFTSVESLALYKCPGFRDAGGLLDAPLTDVALLDPPQRSELHAGCADLLRDVAAKPGLRTLTLTNTFWRTAGSPDVVLGDDVTHVRLLAEPWMIMLTGKWDRAWWSMLRPAGRRHWPRPPVTVLRGSRRRATPLLRGPRVGEALRELTVLGWPTPAEVHTLAGWPGLRVLRVIAADEDLRWNIDRDGYEYPYLDLTEGLRATLCGLPALDRVDLTVLDPDTSKALARGESRPPAMPELATWLAARVRGVGAATEVTLNGRPLRAASA